MLHFTSLPPLSLYVHMPWCVRKCPYCDFNSHEARAPIPEQDYIEALLRDLEQDLPRVWGRTIQSIFIGGGTPSLFSPSAIDRLLSGLRARLLLSQDVEITLEANPGTVEFERFKGFRQAGVNRLSIGVQSFDAQKLNALGRIHGREEAERAAQAARAAGFENFNLDLMFGLPQQTIEQAVADVRRALQFKPTHLSVYQLTLEPNTLFHAQPPQLPDDDAVWEMQCQLQTELAAAGYRQYEVSAYAQAGHACRHNLNYWQFGDYLGIGAGAHGKITDGQGITRLWKVKQPKEYLRHAGTPASIGGADPITRDDAPLEFMMNALRLRAGFSPRLFTERTGLPVSAVEKSLRAAESGGLITWDLDLLRPTETGFRFLNNLVALF